MCFRDDNYVLCSMCVLHSNTDAFLNSADPELSRYTARNEPSNQDLHCLPLYYFCTVTLFATLDVSNFRNGRVHFRNKWGGGGVG